MAKIDVDSSDEIPKLPILPPEQHKFLPKFADYIEKVAAEVHEGRKIKCISVSHSPILKYTQVAINDEQGSFWVDEEILSTNMHELTRLKMN